MKYIKSIPGPGQYDNHQMKIFSRIGASLDRGERD
jgi:hypothetical protein